MLLISPIVRRRAVHSCKAHYWIWLAVGGDVTMILWQRSEQGTTNVSKVGPGNLILASVTCIHLLPFNTISSISSSCIVKFASQVATQAHNPNIDYNHLFKCGRASSPAANRPPGALSANLLVSGHRLELQQRDFHSAHHCNPRKKPTTPIQTSKIARH